MKSHVLLVDDEPRTLLSFSTLLKSTGVRDVTTIDDSRCVIPFLKQQPVALVVLDLSMPFIPGQDLLVEIQQRFPETPVIIMTATNRYGSRMHAKRRLGLPGETRGK